MHGKGGQAPTICVRLLIHCPRNPTSVVYERDLSWTYDSCGAQHCICAWLTTMHDLSCVAWIIAQLRDAHLPRLGLLGRYQG